MDLVTSRFEETDGYPRPEGRLLGFEELKPADVLLSRGASDVSKAIVASDGGSYSHAALWTGSSVIEATLDGMTEHPFTGDRDVYRHRGLEAGTDAKVVAAARAQLGKGYAYTELFLLGALFAAGVRPRAPVVNVALEFLGGRGASRLADWLEKLVEGRRTPRVCTELVALSFYRVEDRRFAVLVLPRSLRPRGASGLEGEPAPRSFAPSGLSRPFAMKSDLDALSEACGSWFSSEPEPGETEPELRAPAAVATPVPAEGQRKFLFGTVARDSVTGARLGVVSPGDLQFSPCLEFVGRITPDAAAAAGKLDER
ncbi:MAG TPA: hypothetical protein VMI54_22340 [Polyangiaceae bacterium]|nr:hypothetical protein [Polyangiaceae bacterium]